MKKIAINIIFLLFFIGCGDSDITGYLPEDSTNQIANIITISGRAIDGYLQNAKVCIDLNQNNKCDIFEPQTLTDVKGNFSLTVDKNLGESSIIIEGGIDIDINEEFNGTLIKYINIDNTNILNINVTPITTILHKLYKIEKIKSFSLIKKELANKLNLDKNILENDPTKDINLFKKTQIIINIIKKINKEDSNLTYDYLFDKITNDIKNSYTQIDFNNAIDNILNTIKEEKGVTLNIDSNLKQIVSKIQNLQISNKDDLSQKEYSLYLDIFGLESKKAFNLINSIRQKAGLNKLVFDDNLSNAAKNHVLYLLDVLDANGTIKEFHKEDSNILHFTGVNPDDRVVYSGYKSRYIFENVSYGQDLETRSVEDLMSAIYHRFAFLNINIDRIGYYDYNKTYVYEMGNSYLNILCSKTSYDKNDSYYHDICADKDFKIEKNIFESNLSIIQKSNPEFIVYPFPNQTSVDPAFYEEIPDPLPDYSVSGYPISVEFNSAKIDITKLDVKSFILKDNENNEVALIDIKNGIKMMNKNTDPNKHFNDFQFAIFPKERLKFNSIYTAIFQYSYNNQDKNITWSFTTKSLSNLIEYNGGDIDINLNKTYNLYIAPKYINEKVINNYKITCSHDSGGWVRINTNLYDRNTITFNIEGSNVSSCKVYVNGVEKLNLY